MNLQDWEGPNTKRMIRYISGAPRERLRSFQPFSRPDGIPGLGLVQSLDNWAKHKALLNLFSFHASRLDPPLGFELLDLNRGAFADGDVVAHLGPLYGLSPQERAVGRFMGHVGFAKGLPGQGYPLDNLAGVYERIRDRVLPAFEEYFA
jgi:hypothetical protein